MKLFVIALIGLLFGSGILISGMADPNKVLNFFDIFGTWDPSLMFVMGGGLAVNLVGYQLINRRRSKPMLAAAFSDAPATTIDARLIGGSMLFGLGWGIAGFCPGAAIPALGAGAWAPVVFVGAMGLGMIAFRVIGPMMPNRQSAA